MILDREQIRRIVRGQKNEHRLPLIRRRGNGWIKRPGYVPGELYPVQYQDEEGKRPTALHIRVVAVGASTVASMDEAAARRCGYESLEDFEDAWPRAWRPDGEMWVIRFEIAQERPRFLAALAGRAPNSDYTGSASRALDPDAEAVDDATLGRYAEENRRRFKRDLEAERERRAGLPVSEQLAAVLEDAKRTGRDVSGDLRVIRRRIEAMKRKTDAA